MSEAVFVPSRAGRFVATELARGPWDPNAQHGGAPAALLAYAFEGLTPDDDLELARATFEFLRPVPLGELAVDAAVVRPGKRVQLLEGSISAVDGPELVRARALRVKRAEQIPPEVLSGGEVPPGPEHGRTNDFPTQPVKFFGRDAIEIRFLDGAFMTPGGSTAWFRLRVPIIAGVELTPLQRLMAAADFGNGIGAVLPWDGYMFINPDLTVYLEREPVGEWLCLESSTRIARDGIGLAESVLYDARGRVGRATQALLVATR